MWGAPGSFLYYQYGEAGLVRVNDCDILRLGLRESGCVIPCTRPLQKAQGAGHPRFERVRLRPALYSLPIRPSHPPNLHRNQGKSPELHTLHSFVRD